VRILNKYLTQDFLVAFLMTLTVFTFVMCLGFIIRAIEIAARGVSGGLILRIFLLNIPYMMTFSIPMSVLTTVLLQFGRLSFDGELTAMKACGLSMWQIVSPIVMLSIVFSFLCIFINLVVAPRCSHAVRSTLTALEVEDPTDLLEAGRFIRDFPGLMIYVGARTAKGVEDIVVYEMDEEGPVRNVRAKTGTIRLDREQQAMFVDLYDVRIDQRERNKDSDGDKSHYINAQHYPVRLDLSRMQKKSVRKKISHMTFLDLVRGIRDVREAFPELKLGDLMKQRMKMVVEANKRLALALSCFAFTLLGIPLGMRSKRRESSVGIAISLLLVFFFYLFIIVANALVTRPELRPDLIVWVPVVLAELAGFALIRRLN
jgi:lipopolysaccharide export system permease protein